MRLVVCLLASLAFAGEASAIEPEQPEGTNCRLAEPPASAGEEVNHGTVLRIFPRARDINAKYTGCQVIWVPESSGWVFVSMTEVLNGDPVRLWSPRSKNPALTACRYKSGRVVSGVAATCAAPEFLLAKSLAPGCVKTIQAAVAVGGVGTQWPKGCEYE